MTLLDANRNQRGIDNWEKMGFQSTGLKSFGIGLTQLRKLAKQVGRDHELALKLWDSDVYDAKVIGLIMNSIEMHKISSLYYTYQYPNYAYYSNAYAYGYSYYYYGDDRKGRRRRRSFGSETWRGFGDWIRRTLLPMD